MFVTAAFAFTLASFTGAVHASLFSISTAYGNEGMSLGMYTPQTVALLDAPNNTSRENAFGGAEIHTEDDSLFVASNNPAGFSVVVPKNGEITTYTVQEGDTLSSIAELFGVSLNTIRWANNISKDTSIRPGQSLVILPVTGVRHVVQKGDTLSSILKKYGGDEEEVLEYNSLTDTTLAIGQEIIIPDGEVKLSPTAKKSSGIASAPTTAKGFLIRPLSGGRKTQGIHGYNAVDIATPSGTAIYASASGTVVTSRYGGWNGGYGNYIVIKHANGVQTLYAHLSQNNVAAGTSVEQGQVIGYSGNSGKSTGPHLHFEVRGAVNPF